MPRVVPELAKDIEDPSRIEEVLTSPRVKCPRCGTLRQPRDFRLCRVCDEAVIGGRGSR